MDVMDLANRSVAETYEQRRMELRVQRVRSIAMSDPQALVDVITRWLDEDTAARGRKRRAVYWPK